MSIATRFLLPIVLLAAGALLTMRLLAPIALRLPDLEDRQQYVIVESALATVVIFTRTDCPVSNRYAPEVRRLHQTFATRNIEFRLVYPDPAESPEMIRAHLAEYAYPCGALRDPNHELVAHTGATITPEAAVFLADGRMIYRGRIDDRQVELGLTRGTPESRDLEQVLSAIIEGRTLQPRTTTAVGCLIAGTR